MTPPVALAVGGTDPSGGAGLAADLKTFAALGVHGASAVTVVTAQNTAEFRQAQPLPPGTVLTQVDAVLSDLDVAATKTGMLWDVGVAASIGSLARTGRLPALVVDPVLASGHGVRIVDEAVDAIYRDDLFPYARAVTPNTVEAGLLLGAEISTVDEAADAARVLGGWGPHAVVVTGGRLRGGAEAVDVVWLGGRIERHAAPWIDTVNVRGSGDVFSAAVCAGLARGASPRDAIEQAHRFAGDAIARAASWRLGGGPGPVAPAQRSERLG